MFSSTIQPFSLPDPVFISLCLSVAGPHFGQCPRLSVFRESRFSAEREPDVGRRSEVAYVCQFVILTLRSHRAKTSHAVSRWSSFAPFARSRTPSKSNGPEQSDSQKGMVCFGWKRALVRYGGWSVSRPNSKSQTRQMCLVD
jgi:hypothetical protein